MSIYFTKLWPGKVKDALAVTGGGVQTDNGKMPGTSYATDPFRCNTGSKLRAIPGTSCSKCYACKIAAFRPRVAKGYSNRHDALLAACEAFETTGTMPEWVYAVSFLIGREAVKSDVSFHRWMDAGDVPHQSAFTLISEVARMLPGVRFWLPTKEAAWFAAWLAEGNTVPANLVVRVSTPRIDATRPVNAFHTSTVHHKGQPIGHVCPASHQGGKCGDCRACWSIAVPNVSYPLH